MYYRLKSTVDAVPVDDEKVLFKSDTLAIRVEGEFSQLLTRQILPMLDGHTSVETIAQRLNLPTGPLQTNLISLVKSGVLEVGDTILEDATLNAEDNLLATLGLPKTLVAERLKARVVIFGLETLGAMVAQSLVQAGFGNLVLVDPFPVQPEDCWPGESLVQGSRERLVRARLLQRNSSVGVQCSESAQITREQTSILAKDADLLIACWDKGFSSGNHWINRASHALGIPALFCELRGLQVYVGPFVVPGMTACYMCTRMRAVAAEEEYEEAMAYERFLDKLKQPNHQRREVFSPGVQTVASLMVAEVFKFVVLNQQPSLLSAVLEYDPFELKFQRHVVLEHPACPVCSEKKTFTRVNIPVWKS